MSSPHQSDYATGTTRKPHVTASFLTIPLELRSIIYELVVFAPFSSRDISIANPFNFKPPTKTIHPRILRQQSKNKNAYMLRNSHLAIAVTCRQAYHELLPIWYGRARFLLPDLPTTETWIRKIGESNASLVHSVCCISRKCDIGDFRYEHSSWNRTLRHFQSLRHLVFRVKTHSRNRVEWAVWEDAMRSALFGRLKRLSTLRIVGSGCYMSSEPMRGFEYDTTIAMRRAASQDLEVTDMKCKVPGVVILARRDWKFSDWFQEQEKETAARKLAVTKSRTKGKPARPPWRP